METMKRVKIYSAYEKYQAEIILGILRNNNIPCYRQGVGLGGYMDIYAGNSLFGEDIYVDEQDAERALELIQATVESGQEEADDDDGLMPEEHIQYKSRFAGKFRIPALMYVIIMIAYILIVTISEILG